MESVSATSLVLYHPSPTRDLIRANEEPCAARAIIYTTLGLASLVANQVKRHALGEDYERDLLVDFATMSVLRGRELHGDG